MWLHRVLVAAHGIFIAVCGLLRCGMQDLVPWPGIEPWTPALGAWSLNHWTTREVWGQFHSIVISKSNLLVDILRGKKVCQKKEELRDGDRYILMTFFE